MHTSTIISFLFITQEIGDHIVILVGMLDNLEKTCEAVAGFWTNQAENFDSQGAKMNPLLLRAMKDVTVKKSISFWTEAKGEMDRYVQTISVVDGCFNFVTSTKQSSIRSIKLPTLELTLQIPSNIRMY